LSSFGTRSGNTSRPARRRISRVTLNSQVEPVRGGVEIQTVLQVAGMSVSTMTHADSGYAMVQ
jgi:hypothetical protein